MRTRELADLLASEKRAQIIHNGLRVQRYPGYVVNIDTADGSTLTAVHLASFREDLKALGVQEIKSWVASQGTSWLTPGEFAGISIAFRPI